MGLAPHFEAHARPKSLAEKLAEGNLGHRPLKKLEFSGSGGIDPHQPPEYLLVMEKREQAQRTEIPTPTQLYTDTVEYLKPTDCLNLIPSAMIAELCSRNLIKIRLLGKVSPAPRTV